MASVDVVIPHTQEPPPILPKICKVRRSHPAFIFPAFMGFPFPIQAGGSPIHKRGPPCQQSPTPARLSPYAGAVPPHVSTAPTTLYACADPHRFSRLPICFHDSPIQPPSSKKSDTDFAETSVSGPANQAPAGLHEFPAPTAGAVPHVQAGHHTRRDQRPVYSNARPTNLLKFTALTRGAWVWRRFATRRRRRSGGLRSSPPEGGLLRRGSPGNRGSWIQQKPADAAPDPQGGSRRPGVTHAPRRWGTVSLSFQVSLAVFR